MLIEKPGQTHHRLEFEQGECGRRVIEVDLASAQLIDQGWRERIQVDFQTKGERGPWAQPRPNTASRAIVFRYEL